MSSVEVPLIDYEHLIHKQENNIHNPQTTEIESVSSKPLASYKTVNKILKKPFEKLEKKRREEKRREEQSKNPPSICPFPPWPSTCSAAIKSSCGWLIPFGPQTDRTEEEDSTATHGDWIGNPTGSIVGPRRKKRTARVRARTEPASRGCV